MTDNFEIFKKLTLQFEGGYANRSKVDDPAGETFAGITRKNHPDLDMWLDLDHLKKIGKSTQEINKMLPQYASFSRAFDAVYRSYWDSVQADYLPFPFDTYAADYAFHSGAKQAIKDLQRAVCATPDGIMGVETLALCSKGTPEQASNYLDRRLSFMQKLKNWDSNKNGWKKRIEKLRDIKVG